MTKGKQLHDDPQVHVPSASPTRPHAKISAAAASAKGGPGKAPQLPGTAAATYPTTYATTRAVTERRHPRQDSQAGGGRQEVCPRFEILSTPSYKGCMRNLTSCITCHLPHFQ